MNDEDKLFEKNALLAIWLMVKETRDKVDGLLDDLNEDLDGDLGEENDDKTDEENVNDE